MTLFPSSGTTWRHWALSLAVFLLGLLFDLFFWEMEIGLNLSLFALIAMAGMLGRYGFRDLSLAARWSLLGTLIAATMVYVHHSVVAVAATFLGLAVSAAFVHEKELRTLLYALPQSFAGFFMAPVSAWDGITQWRGGGGRAQGGWRWARIALVPVLVAVLFFQIYRAGNPKFDALTAGVLDGFFRFLGEFFTEHVLFFLVGLMISAALLRRQAPLLMARFEQRWTDALLRVRVRRPHWAAPRAMDPLERERRGGVVLLVLVNALLLVVNTIDIAWVWFGFTVPEDFSLKQFVHEGTWLLIISILLSMLILLHLFRGNLNFYGRSGTLKKLAFVWIAQNFVLGISVFLRNYHYISFHGLAYKRIGVIVFLGLVLVGLVTLYIKVWRCRSFFYLARVNGWAWFAVLVGLTVVDWDSTIVRYNLAHDNPGEIDIDNYLEMSDKVLPLLYADLEKVELQMARHRNNRVRWVDHLDPAGFRSELDAKRDRFIARYTAQHWQERNRADDRTIAGLNQLAVRTLP